MQTLWNENKKGLNINNNDYYNHIDPTYNERTKERLIEIKGLGLTEVGFGQFGIEGLMSGLYVEKLWHYSEENWNAYVDWIKEVKQKKK